ncbi:glycosyltransferase [Allorhodopirellula heiligendammensis]|uniref:Glycosyl transferases group 1 n=1 Tax=Allorhodopirellula heiligendammensis TaxID=2714739 RepID=A0A5C6C4H9_9BACT|nr:glycosyltransferase [Allorhodopirellula heiligendammensis]TWU18992.1 Glycosyl transferases group 1 [Allorhodopirellula heiligendammensis]
MAKILYTGMFRFPDGDAGAARVLGIGKALRDAGHEVFFAGGEASERAEDCIGSNTYQYQGFPYRSMQETVSANRSPIGRFHHFIGQGNRTLEWIATNREFSPDMIISYHGTAAFLTKLKSYCQSNRIALASDNTEWQNAFQLPGGVLGPPYWSQELRQRRVMPKIGNVIAISSYLRNYFKKRKCNVVQVPPLVDLEEAKWNWGNATEKVQQLDSLRLVYAGSPGRKDSISSILSGIADARQHGLDVTVDFLGPSELELASAVGSDLQRFSNLDEAVRCFGRIPQSLIPFELSKRDATILVRPDMRYAHAGFPTKVVESLASGLPVFTNRTSDIDAYVQDGKDAVLLNDATAMSVVGAIYKWFGWSSEQRDSMRRSARCTARELFDYRSHVDGLNAFVVNCLKHLGGDW